MAERDRFHYDLEPLVALFPIEGLNTWESKFTLKPAILTDASNIDWSRAKDAVSMAKGRDSLVSGLGTPIGLGRFTNAATVPTADRTVAVVNVAGAAVWKLVTDAGAPTTLTLPTTPGVTKVKFASFAFKNITMGCNGVDRPLKVAQNNLTVATRVGIDAPVAAPTVALGAAGNLNGAYQWRVTFQSATHESSPGPVSTKLTAVNQAVNLTVIPTSTDTQVTARNIYRIGGIVPSWQFVGIINDNITTTFTDNIADLNLGSGLTFFRDPPPNAITGWVEHKQRIFGFVGNQLQFSNYQEPEGWNPLNAFNIGSSSNIQALGSTGSILLVFKDAQTFGLLGESLADFIVVPVFRKGTIAPDSVVSAEGLVFWLADDGVRYSDGRETKLIGLEIKTKVDALTQAQRNSAVGAYGGNRYILSFPGQFTSAFDFITQRWEIFPWTADFIVSAYDEAGLAAFVIDDFATPGSLEKWPGAGYLDLGVPISWFLERDRLDSVRRAEYHLGPRHYFEERSAKSIKRFRDAEIVCPPQPTISVTLTITIDGDTVNKLYTKVVDLTTGVQRVGLPPNMIGKTAKVRISGTNSVVVEIAGAVLWGYLERPYSTN